MRKVVHRFYRGACGIVGVVVLSRRTQDHCQHRWMFRDWPQGKESNWPLLCSICGACSRS